MLLSVYELLALTFGLAGAVWFLFRRDRLGLALSLWALMSLLAYSLASERMPWLTVNLVVPLSLLAGAVIARLSEQVRWRGLPPGWARYSGVVLVLLFFALPVLLVWPVFILLDPLREFSLLHLLMLVAFSLGLAVAAVLLRLSGLRAGLASAGAGVAGLLLVFGGWSAFQAAYTYDDSRVEMLAYAQGSAGVRENYEFLDRELFLSDAARPSVKIDLDSWYPLQWYVRQESLDGVVLHRCFEPLASEGSGCLSPDGAGNYGYAGVAALVVSSDNVDLTPALLPGFWRDDLGWDLLWFPEVYRRLGEDRSSESLYTQLWRDGPYLARQAVSPGAWASALAYVFERRVSQGWWHSGQYLFWDARLLPDPSK